MNKVKQQTLDKNKLQNGETYLWHSKDLNDHELIQMRVDNINWLIKSKANDSSKKKNSARRNLLTKKQGQAKQNFANEYFLWSINFFNH